jgi:hypothetical protein
MTEASSETTQLPLAPLGSGDLIDRAVRLYRRHLSVLIRTAAPPVIIAAFGWILLGIFGRRAYTSSDTFEVLLNFFISFVAVCIVVIGYLFLIVVMGGATRTLVAHLLRNDPVTASATYKAVRSRFAGLLGVSALLFTWILLSWGAGVAGAYMVFAITIFIVALLSFIGPSWLAGILFVIGSIGATLLGLVVFFFILGRAAYVPQVMMVEGKGVLDSFSRSFTLARGNIKRLMAMCLFTFFATNSALMILLSLLSFYGYINGVDLLNASQWPMWYSIAQSVLPTLSSILLAPVWMLGLSLLYVDERVRHEGYDIELMATRQLPEMPNVDVTSPLGTALSSNERRPAPPPPPPVPRPAGGIFNLN